MRAVCWRGTKDVRVEDVPAPTILNPRDAIVKVSSTAICGSDLHVYNGLMSSMRAGDVLGHEFMGEVVAVGSAVKSLREGDRVVVPCVISCGGCTFCKQRLFACCDNSNPNAVESQAALGVPGCGMFGLSHLSGGYAGGQAELVRVPFADVGPFKVPDLPDERVLFLSDILPTGWMGAENCKVEPGDTVAVWGCGPVGQLAIRSLFLQGAHRVIAIDRVQARLALAEAGGAESIDYSELDVYERLLDMTGGHGPVACLDAVGMEANAPGAIGVVERVKQVVGLEQDRPGVLRQMIRCVRKSGRISLLGAYSGNVDAFPIGVAFNKGVTFRMSPVHVHRYTARLLELIVTGKLDPSVIISHTLHLEDAAEGYRMFHERVDGCTKVILKTASTTPAVRDPSVASK